MKVVVLAGGISTERDVSLSSGAMIYQALKRKGHAVFLLDVYLGYDGELTEDIFLQNESGLKASSRVATQNPDIETVKAMRTQKETGFFGPNVLALCKRADIVFMALHGENGENGKIQATFDLLGIRYTGTDYVSSALCMDKAITKELLRANHLPTAQSYTLRRDGGITYPNHYPQVVKTCCGGSSVGVYIVKDEVEFEEALREAFTYEEEVIVEEYIKGREFSIGLLEGKALPIIEIAPLQGFYDYKNKYQAGSTIETCPAILDAEITCKMQQAAQEVYRVLRLQTYARIDFMLREDNEFFCLEANTLPGMTPTSLLPQEAKAIGMDYDSLCDYIIKLSLDKPVVSV